MNRQPASISLDLDNKWSYMKTHGDEGWEAFPSYFDLVVPRVLRLLAKRGLKITFFVVGQDAVLPENRRALKSLGAAGHEIGNHSFHHEPWLHLYSRGELAEELRTAEEAIEEATGCRPRGFRGPGFSFSDELLAELCARGYQYDASTFPTFLGPLARLYYFLHAKLDHSEREERKQLFGKISEGFRPLKPYDWNLPSGRLLEIPVTTMPLLRIPIHASYLLYLSKFSVPLAKAYFRVALGLCRLCRVSPSFLLHPLDFLGSDDEQGLDFFPAMGIAASVKVALVEWALDKLGERYDLVTMEEHAERCRSLRER
jgi:peptidoglycan/xylan/chitin deacetylase (PgdA/CDA1 family)